MASNHNKIIRDWLGLLGTMCPPLQKDLDADATMRLYTDALKRLHLPDAVYCDDARAHVARESQYFPAYKVLADLLSGWWKEHQPAPLPRLIGPGGVHLTVVDEHWVKHWQTRILEADCQSWGKRRHLMHLIRERSMNAYGYLATTDELAARIAVAEGWLRGSKPIETDADLAARMQAEWGDRAAVQQSVAGLLLERDGSAEREAHVTRCLALLKGLLQAWAPENLDLIPGGIVTVA
jgi:hypothetical protein